MSRPVCSSCGTEMNFVHELDERIGQRDPSGGRLPAYLKLGGVCPNPDCPQYDPDMAKASEQP